MDIQNLNMNSANSLAIASQNQFQNRETSPPIATNNIEVDPMVFGSISSAIQNEANMNRGSKRPISPKQEKHN